MKPLHLALLMTSIIASAVQAAPGSATPRSTEQFEKFFWGWDEKIQKILARNCTEPYDNYRYGEFDPEGSASQLVNPVVNCILDSLPENNKAEMGASAVVMGLLPTMLQYLGSTPVETAVISVQQPLLSVLLAVGSPSVAPMKVDAFYDTMQRTIGDLSDSRALVVSRVYHRRGRLGLASRVGFIALYVCKYLAVLVAAANVVALVARLSFHAIAIVAPKEVFLPLLWGLMCVVIHLGAVAILRLRFRIRGPSENAAGRWYDTVKSYLVDSVRVSTDQWPKSYTPREEKMYRAPADFLTWLLCFGTVINLIFGTLIFSSLLFFSVMDSICIIGRFIGSSLVCRAVVKMELHIMGQMSTTERKEIEDIEMDGVEDGGPKAGKYGRLHDKALDQESICPLTSAGGRSSNLGLL